MSGFIKCATLLAVKLAMATMMAGCQSSAGDDIHRPASGTVADASGSQQLIIKFKSNTITCDPAGIARVSAAAHVSLEFVRPMSGDACVVKHLADDPGSFSAEQQMLRQHPAIEWVELDAVLKKAS
jgi:hypothetical protein